MPTQLLSTLYKVMPTPGEAAGMEVEVTDTWSQKTTEKRQDLRNLDSGTDFLICTLEWLGGIYNFK